MKRNFAVLMATVAMVAAGCRDGDIDGEYGARAAALTSDTLEPARTIVMPPLCSVDGVALESRDQEACAYLKESLIPADCNYFVVINRPGRDRDLFRSYGVCTRPAQVYYQIEGSFAATPTGAPSDFERLTGRFGSESASKNRNQPDFGTGGGGYIAKCCVPPLPNSEVVARVLLRTARNIQQVHEYGDALLDELALGGE